LAQADQIASEIGQRAIREGSTAAWIGREWLEDAEAFQLGCLSHDLYNGSSGIALFLAAHAKVRGSDQSRELAYAGLRHTRLELSRPGAARLVRTIGIGGASGVGSVVYALAVIGNLLSDGELLEDALTAAALLGPESIAADKRLDIMGGSAGAVLSLLRLYRETSNKDVLGRAIRCGEHLLAQPKHKGRKGSSWIGQGAGDVPLTGMSHGAAGFAYALGALFQVTRIQEFKHAALECLEFEDALYDDVRKNWPDLRSGDAQQWPVRWCHGSPGIGLARAGLLQFGLEDASLLAKDLVRSVESEKQTPPSKVDTLCCGNLGRVEHLREAAAGLHREDVGDLADDLLGTVLAAAGVQGDFQWDDGSRRFNIGLFRGLAGVGYSCLRQSARGLPNVLLLQ
jgi:type 2 lantibiotic biosynthesis protein LanM